MSAIKPHLAEAGESTELELDYWECSTSPRQRSSLRGVEDEGPSGLCPPRKEVLDFSHSGLMNMAYVRKVIVENFKGASITPSEDKDGEIVLWTNKLSEAPPWNPSAGGLMQNNKLLSWTSKMGAPSFSLPAGPDTVGGACPGATAGMSVVDVNIRKLAAKRVLQVLRQKDPIDPAKCVCQFCYAEGGQYSTGSVQFAQVLRFLWTQKAINVDMQGREVADVSKSMFVRVMALAISRANFKQSQEPKHWGERKFFRLHDSGDFFSPRYFAAWKAVTLLFPEITFWAPTRAWALGSVAVDSSGKVDRSGWVEAVNEINGDAMESNFVIRPSAYEVNRHGPVREILGPGWAAATTVYTPSGKADDPGFDWDCKAYEAEKGPTCRGAEAPPDPSSPNKKGPIGCRACWVKPDLRVNYTLH